VTNLKIYIVRPGDTLTGIARRFGTTVEKLAFDNQLSDPSRLPVGLALALPAAGGEGPAQSIETNGYAYPGVRPSVLNETLDYLTFLCPFSWQTDENGTLKPIDDQELITSAYEGGAAPILTVTNIGSSGGFSGDAAHAVLTDAGVQDSFIQNLLSALRGRHYYGADIDFEYVFPFDRDSYNRFIKRLSETLHPLGYYFMTTVAPKTSDDQPGLLYQAADYAAHGKYADRVIIMTYEWGYTYSPPQAVSPVSRMRGVLDYAVTRIPPGKILMGLSNYGYSWAVPWKQGSAARIISNAAAADLASAVYAEIKFDDSAQAPHFTYTDAAGVRREVWFEDARSFSARLRLVSEFGLAGVSIWTVNQLYRPGLLALHSLYSAEKIL
jgi:spore germination protein